MPPTSQTSLKLPIILAFTVFAGLLYLGLTTGPTAINIKLPQKLGAAVILGTGNTFYVSSSTGDDTNTGTSEASPFKTLEKVSSLSTLQAGDNILLKRGDTFTGKLIIAKSGSASAPITIADYGSGSAPIIDGAGTTDFGIYSDSQNYVTIANLDIRNQYGSNNPSTGIGLVNTNNFIIDNVTVSNVTGLAGIYIYSNVAGRSQNNIIQNSTITGTNGSLLAKSGNNSGNAIQFLGECDTCGSNNSVKNSTTSNNNGIGIAIFMKNTTVTGNTVTSNSQYGIAGGDLRATNTLVNGNNLSGNCKKLDDCFGINFFRTGGNNTITNNTLTGQHNTLTDSGIPANAFPGFKVGTGGIRFDGGDKSLVTNPAFGPGSDYMDQTGNVVSNNQIQNEYDGIQIFNYNNVSLTGNTVTSINSSRADIYAAADNTSNKTITVTADDNTLNGPKKIVTTNATITGNNGSTGSTSGSTSTTTPPEIKCTPITYYADKDKDSYGDPQNATSTCSQPSGYVTNKKDCNDNTKATRSTFNCPSRNSGSYRTY